MLTVKRLRAQKKGMEFHRKLQELIDTRKTTQAAVARAMEVTDKTIENWRVGKFEPSFAKLRRLAEYFDVPFGWLVDPTDDRKLKQVEREEGWLRALRRVDLETAERRVVGAHESFELDPSQFEQPPRRSRKAE